jgi:hypothetical protein
LFVAVDNILGLLTCIYSKILLLAAISLRPNSAHIYRRAAHSSSVVAGSRHLLSALIVYGRGCWPRYFSAHLPLASELWVPDLLCFDQHGRRRRLLQAVDGQLSLSQIYPAFPTLTFSLIRLFFLGIWRSCMPYKCNLAEPQFYGFQELSGRLAGHWFSRG